MAQNPPSTRPATPAPSAPGAPSAQAPGALTPPKAAAAPAAPEPTRIEIQKFDNWVVTCNEFAEGPRTRACSAVTRFFNQNKQLVFQWTVAVDNNKQLGTVMETVPGVAIPPGIELRIGKSASHKIPYMTCETDVCVARSNVDANLLRELTGSPTAEVVIQGSQGNTVLFPIEMKGFDRAYAVLSRP
jgi:invasion protein IalB